MAASAESCRRFVAPSNSPLPRNLCALWKTDPALALALESVPDNQVYPVAHSPDGHPVLSLPDPGGKAVQLHSRFDPVRDAGRLIDPLDLAGKVAFYVHGLGLGYHVRELFRRCSADAVVFVLEPDLRLLRTALEHLDLEDALGSGRLQIITRAEKSELFLRLQPHSALISMGLEGVLHAPSLRIAPEFHRQMQGWIEEFAAFTRTSLNTLVVNGTRTVQNIARNIAWYASNPGIGRLAGRYRGVPGIVVSAGPSLRKNVHLLRQAREGAVLISVQTALKVLLEHQVEPDFVTSLDWSEVSTRFFENLPPSLKSELVAEPKASDAVLGLFPGPVTIVGNEISEAILREMQLARPRLPAGATVAHLAFYLAEFLGCDPIIFVGQDLGFSDGLCYAPGTGYDEVWRPELSRFCTLEMKQWEQIARDRPILRRIPDWHGGSIYTEERLFTYLQQFERDFARCKSQVIDATEGGALKRGATPMTLESVIRQFCGHRLPRRASDHPGLDLSALVRAAECLRNRIAECDEIRSISAETLTLLEELKRAGSDPIAANRVLARIDQQRVRIAALESCYNLVTQMTQRTELRRFQADRRIEASSASEQERQSQRIERDLENVRAIDRAAGELSALLQGVLKDIEQVPQPARRGAA
jgi:hypothetical protein